MSDSVMVLDDTFIEFVINGQTVNIEAMEAVQILGTVDRRHEHDANECQACYRLTGPSEKCPGCGSDQLQSSRSFRDDLSATLVKEFGCPMMSGRTAMRIYHRILEVASAKKKLSETMPESRGGSAETPTAGQSVASGPGSP